MLISILVSSETPGRLSKKGNMTLINSFCHKGRDTPILKGTGFSSHETSNG